MRDDSGDRQWRRMSSGKGDAKIWRFAYMNMTADRSIDMHIKINSAPESGHLLNGNLVMGFRFITVDYTLLVLCIINV